MGVSRTGNLAETAVSLQRGLYAFSPLSFNEGLKVRFFSSVGKSIQCGLCPRGCLLESGEMGQCKVRFNRDGKGDVPFYGFITALSLDPIEKKPLYHFRPGTEILSAGFVGCNLHCPFCQNWRISQNTEVRGKFYTPEELVKAALKAASATPKAGRAQASLAYTYSEPLIHIEYLLDCMKEAHKAGIANVLVSNGCVTSEAASEVLELCDAANIDLKCFSKETYSKIMGGDLIAVITFIREAIEKGVHLELTTLLVPGLNDSKAELDKCKDFIAELEVGGKAVPWHISAFHTNYKWSGAATKAESLLTAVEQAKEKLKFVYPGNIACDNNTPCPSCGQTLIDRRNYRVDISKLSLREENGKQVFFCASCGQKAPVYA